MLPIISQSAYHAFEIECDNVKQSMESSTAILQYLLEKVESGRIPLPEDENQLHISLDNLHQNYDRMYEKGSELAGKNNLPGSGVSPDEVKEAVRNNAYTAERFLRDFLSVKAVYGPHKKALSTWKNQANVLWMRLHSLKLKEEDIENEIKPYQLFISALHMGPEDSEEKEELFDLIDHVFEPCISRVLYSGKYVISHEEKESSCAEEQDMPNAVIIHRPEKGEISSGVKIIAVPEEKKAVETPASSPLPETMPLESLQTAVKVVPPAAPRPQSVSKVWESKDDFSSLGNMLHLEGVNADKDTENKAAAEKAEQPAVREEAPKAEAVQTAPKPLVKVVPPAAPRPQSVSKVWESKDDFSSLGNMLHLDGVNRDKDTENKAAAETAEQPAVREEAPKAEAVQTAPKPLVKVVLPVSPRPQSVSKVWESKDDFSSLGNMLHLDSVNTDKDTENKAAASAPAETAESAEEIVCPNAVIVKAVPKPLVKVVPPAAPRPQTVSKVWESRDDFSSLGNMMDLAAAAADKTEASLPPEESAPAAGEKKSGQGAEEEKARAPESVVAAPSTVSPEPEVAAKDAAEKAEAQPAERKLVDIAALAGKKEAKYSIIPQFFDKRLEGMIDKLCKKGLAPFLQLLTSISVFTEEQFCEFGQFCGCITARNKSDVLGNLHFLVSKGCIRKLKLDIPVMAVSHELCSLIKNRMHKRNCVVSLPCVGMRQYDNSLEHEEVVQILQQNENLLYYLHGLSEHAPEVLAKVLASVRLYNRKIEVGLACKGTFLLCLIGDPAMEKSITKNHMLFSFTGELPDMREADGEHEYFACADHLYHWHEGWQQLAPEDLFVSDSSGEESGTEKEEASLPEESAEPVAEPESVPVEEPAEEPQNEEKAGEDEPAAVEEESEEEFCPDEDLPDEEDVEVIPDNEPLSSTAARFAEYSDMPSDTTLRQFILRLLKHSVQHQGDPLTNPYIAQALMLAKAAALHRLPRCSRLYHQLLLATAAPLGRSNQRGENLNRLFTDSPVPQALVLSAYIYALFAPRDPDFVLQTQAESYRNDYDNFFPDFPDLKSLFVALCHVHSVTQKGFTPAILARLSDEEVQRRAVAELQKKAQGLMCMPNIKARLNGMGELRANIFGSKSDLYRCMSIIAQNRQPDSSQVEEVAQLWQSFCKDSDTAQLDDKKLDEYLDNQWSIASSNYSTDRLLLEYTARKKSLEALEERLLLMHEWLERVSGFDASQLEELSKLRNTILHELKHLPLQSEAEDKVKPCAGLVDYMVHLLICRLEQNKEPSLFTDALRTGVIALDRNFLPVLDRRMCHVAYYEPWRRVMQHIALPDMTVEEANEAISGDRNSPLFDNLFQQSLIARFLHQEEQEFVVSDKVLRLAQNYSTDFMGKLELAYAAGQLTEPDKEDLCQLLSTYQEEFFEAGDFGCWRQFLTALGRQEDDYVRRNRAELQQQIEKRRAGAQDSVWLDKAESRLEAGQFAVAEEMLNNFDLGKDDNTEDQKDEEEQNPFLRFLSPEVYDQLEDFCARTKSRSLNKEGEKFIRENFPEDWTTHSKEESRKFISCWPSSGRQEKHKTMQGLLSFVTSLGFVTTGRISPKYGTTQNADSYEIEIKATPRNRQDYPHPFACFGTGLKPPLTVVTLYGSRQPQELVDTINSLAPARRSYTLVLLDFALSRVNRCQLAEQCHKTSGMYPFIVIDRILALYLALQLENDRFKTMLSCTLPYAIAPQPFVSEGATSDEMFCGRDKELKALLDMNGASLVYGGRQLGKTALLQRAQSLMHDPEHREFAVYCSIREYSRESEVVKCLTGSINMETRLALPPSDNLKDFCHNIDVLMHNGKISALLLLMDEADAFLKNISADKYRPIQPLVELKRTQSNFKFVLAGLNNVYRARESIEDNSVVGQLGLPLCIKPLSPSKARQLLLRPLRYLGFRLERDSQLETILSSTNYYPGIIQFFGYTLVQTLNEEYSRYYRASDGTPPFILSNEHLGMIMKSDELNNIIKEKFKLSLALDVRYFMLARCIAWYYMVLSEDMVEGYKGYTIDQIRDMAENYQIRCLINLSRNEYRDLLDEMTDMGILHRSQPGVYRLRKRSFLDIIGTNVDELEMEIEEENNRSSGE